MFSSLLLFLVLLGSSAAGPQGVELDLASSLYRQGDLVSSQTLWLEALDEPAPALERSRLCANLGTAAYREGRTEESVAWFSAALALDPRNDDLLHDLELTRAQAGMPGLDSGSLLDALGFMLTEWTPAEAGWIGFGGLLLLSLMAVLEAIRGGRRTKQLLMLVVLIQPLFLGPLLARNWNSSGDPYMVIEASGVLARAEPRPDSSRQAHLAPGSVHDRIDSWPGWILLRGDDGQRHWVPEDSTFQLTR
jgi:tetratricopeptide (TPR) repeat protein